MCVCVYMCVCVCAGVSRDTHKLLFMVAMFVNTQSLIVLELALTDLHRYLRGIRFRYVVCDEITQSPIISATLCISVMLQSAVHQLPPAAAPPVQSRRGLGDAVPERQEVCPQDLAARNISVSILSLPYNSRYI